MASTVDSNIFAGTAFVIYGSVNAPAQIDLNSTLDLSVGFKISAVSVYSLVGVSVSAAGDFNNDRVDDVLVGGY